MISCDNLINLYKKNTEKESDKVFGVKLIAIVERILVLPVEPLRFTDVVSYHIIMLKWKG